MSKTETPDIVTLLRDVGYHLCGEAGLSGAQLFFFRSCR
jgi:hypothetical protein